MQQARDCPEPRQERDGGRDRDGGGYGGGGYGGGGDRDGGRGGYDDRRSDGPSDGVCVLLCVLYVSVCVRVHACRESVHCVCTLIGVYVFLSSPCRCPWWLRWRHP